MENKAFTCQQCWKDERISQVINKEAVSIDKASFLATHAPLNKIVYERKPLEMADTSERGLLNELRRCATENRHTFAVVQGIPGTGKSHLIRWLKESFEAFNRESQGNDVILLIERAQCNLRSTLLQIIQSGIFKDEALHRQLEKLKGATTELSKNALEDTLLDQLRIATSEVQLPAEHLPRKQIQRRIDKFLLDFYVRQELKKRGGPIDRLTRSLSVGTTAILAEDELPGFKADDFAFDIATLRAIRDEGGYKEARELAESLQDPDDIDLRDELAKYFNRLLNYAVGRTTALSTDDLKQMFNELRRHLRQQNLQLSLFIEDITAFTGIDVGLIDVLATQHTGEGNREFCRLLSVIGITDSYFNDRFPDNMRERVTHRLTLNRIMQGQVASDLLQTPRAVAELSARYLNAMRLEQSALEHWVLQGARPERLPNACDSCEFKTLCHNAFGFVELDAESDAPQQVGLYPFNEQAIWTMYQNLVGSSKTPRSLLNSVLEYVLESHGKKIALGEFPPPAQKLGSDFKAPPLKKLAQLNIIDAQGRDYARRIETLVLFWGTGTIDATNNNRGRLVGGLPEGVYTAFDIPFIEGEASSSSPSVSVAGQSRPSSYKDAYPIPGSKIVEAGSPYGMSQTWQSVSPSDQSLPRISHIEEFQQAEIQQSKYTVDINNWLKGGKLQNFEKLRGFLLTLIGSFVDWEAHGISSIQFDDRLSGRRMAIEDQAGKIQNDSLVFKRSQKLAAVLQALADLNEGNQLTSPEAIGGHIAVLSSWLYEHEQSIVDFVRRPTSQSTEKIPLTTILLLNCVLLACLEEKLAYKAYSTQELLLTVIKECTQADTLQWQKCTEEAQKTHTTTWVDLMKRVDNRSFHVRSCQKDLLQMLNRAQGDSTSVRFIDTAMALDILEAFDKSDWTLSSIENVGVSAAPAWIRASEIYRALQMFFGKALDEEQEQIAIYISNLRKLIGSAEPKAVFKAINDWIEHMRHSQRVYKLEPKPALNATRLSKVKATFEATVKERDTKQRALRLSSIADTMKDAQEHLAYFNAFVKEVSEQIQRFERDLPQLRAESSVATQLPPLAEQAYSEIEDALLSVAEIKEVLQ